MMEPVLRIFIRTRKERRVDLEHRLPEDSLERIFCRMDSADGNLDGRIDCEMLIETLDMLDGRKGSDPFVRAKDRVILADRNHDGYLERQEFYELLRGLREDEEKERESRNWLEKYLQVAADAEQYRWCPPPLFTFTITVSQVGFFVFHVFHFLAKAESIFFTWKGPYQFCSALILNPFRRYEVWRFFSYVLVHAGIEHLLVNVFLQVLVGLPLELSNGSLRVAMVYVSGALAGSLGMTTIKPTAYLAGASGAVFSLVGGHMASMALNWKEDKLVTRHRLSKFVRKQSLSVAKKTAKANKLRLVRLFSAVLLCGLDLLFNQLLAGSASYVAHSCGLLAGLLAGLMVMKNRRVERWESGLRIAATVLLCLLFAAAVSWNILGDDIVGDGGNVRYFNPPDYSVAQGQNGTCRYII